MPKLTALSTQVVEQLTQRSWSDDDIELDARQRSTLCCIAEALEIVCERMMDAGCYDLPPFPPADWENKRLDSGDEEG